MTRVLPGGSVPAPPLPTRSALCQEDRAAELPRLSPKQFQIVEQVMRGKKNREVAELLGTTEQVIKNYMHFIFEKTGVDDRLNLALWWLKKKPRYIAAGLIAE